MRILISIAIIFSLLSPNWLIGTDEELYGTPDADYEFVGRIWNETPDEIKQTWPSEYLAYGVGLSSWEFNYMARVVQAESNGTYDWSDFEDKVLIAAVIFNRVEDSRFANTISGVLSEPGQFTTTSGGWCSTSSSESSRWAIVEAERRLLNGEIPSNLLYFNCLGYSYGTAYGCYGGNYFTCA